MELGFDPSTLIRLKPIQKVGVAFGILLLIAAGSWQFLIKDLLEAIDALNGEIAQQEESIRSKEAMLKRLPKLRKELEELKLQEADAARRLPSKKEIPALLTDISNAGHEQGLTFLLFAPKAEIPAEIHAEVPVDLQVVGSYHETALFLQEIARLPRIVTVSDIQMAPDKNGLQLQTTARATTYRFLDAEELTMQEQQKKAKTAKAVKQPDKAKKE